MYIVESYQITRLILLLLFHKFLDTNPFIFAWHNETLYDDQKYNLHTSNVSHSVFILVMKSQSIAHWIIEACICYLGTWKVISSSLDINYVHDDFHWSSHKTLISCLGQQPNLIQSHLCWVITYAGLILGLPSASERRRYKVTPSLIGWAQT